MTGGTLASQGRTASKSSQRDIWAPSANEMWQIGQGNYSPVAPASSFSNFAFSGNTSNMPSIQSPMGLPMRGQGVTYQQGETMVSPLSANPLRAYSAAYTSTPPGFENNVPTGYTGYSPAYQQQALNQAAFDTWINASSQHAGQETAGPHMQNPLYGAEARAAGADATSKQNIDSIPKR